MKGCPRSLIPVGARAHERRSRIGDARPAARRAALARARPLASEGLEARLARGPISGYIGFDASARSLHVGHLLQVFLLTHLQRAGGRPVIVIGGGTGMIGDPSGKSSERNLLDDATIAANAAALRGAARALPRLLAGPDAGAHGRQPRLAGADVRARLPARHRQALHRALHAREGLRAGAPRRPACPSRSSATRRSRRPTSCTSTATQGVDLQMGGADQWGNITAGLELIRRVERASADDADGGDDGEQAAEPRLRPVQPAAAHARRPEDGQVRARRGLPRPDRSPARTSSTSTGSTMTTRSSSTTCAG